METSIATSTQNNPDQTNEIVTRIINLVMVQQIYCSTRLDKDKPLTELIILISDKSSKTLIELFPILDMVFEDYPEYCYRLYHVHQAKDSIKKGNLFFYQVCVAENLCFSDPAVELNLFSQMQGLEKVIEKAKNAFNKEIAKIQAFNDGAAFYLQKENYALTAFMVHQQIELAYRAIELFAMGKDKMTHSIRVHQKHLRPYLPALGELFDEANDFENKLMQHLDDAYLKVRYGEGYQINKEKLLKAMKKGAEAQQFVASIYEKMIDEFEQKLHAQKEDQIVTSQTDTVSTEERCIGTGAMKVSGNKFFLSHGDEKLFQINVIDVTVEQVYCIGHKSNTYTEKGLLKRDTLKLDDHNFLLLVITKESCGADSLNVQNITEENKNIKVTLLVHSLKNVNDALTDNNPFFHQVFRSDGLIYQNETNPGLIDLPAYDQSKALSGSLVWFRRHSRAAAMLAAAVEISELDEGVVEACLISQAAEQICIGFIYASIGYRPNQHSLKHLFNICRYINPAIDGVFPTSTEDDKELLAILIDANKNARYRHFINVDQIDLCVLHRRCNAWMKKAEELVSLQFAKDC